MSKLVEEMQNGEFPTYEIADSIKKNTLNNAKVIVSTLNYSANNTLLPIKMQKRVKFIIVDEGKVSSCLVFNVVFTIIVQLVKVLKLIVFYHFILVAPR